MLIPSPSAFSLPLLQSVQLILWEDSRMSFFVTRWGVSHIDLMVRLTSSCCLSIFILAASTSFGVVPAALQSAPSNSLIVAIASIFGLVLSALPRPGGSKGFARIPLLDSKRFCFTVQLKCATVWKWSTSLAAIENHHRPSKCGCSYATRLFTEDRSRKLLTLQRWRDARKYVRKLIQALLPSQNGLRSMTVSKSFLGEHAPRSPYSSMLIICMYTYTTDIHVTPFNKSWLRACLLWSAF